MSSFRKAFAVAGCSFRSWRRNPRIIITFGLAFVLCFLLSDKAVRFATQYGTLMQITESFVWTFGDSNSILLASLLLLLLFADMPFITAGTPFYLMRTDRRTWLAGQGIYIIGATLIYLLFVLASTALISMPISFAGNIWSETAAVLGYSGAGREVALPALIKTLEMSRPFQCTAAIFALISLYALLMAFVMLLCNLKGGSAGGVIGALAFNLYGFLLKPDTIKTLFRIDDELGYLANAAAGWLSPLNHATYHLHNFGFDVLPRLWQTYAIFALLIALLFVLSLRAARSYNFNFAGSEGD